MNRYYDDDISLTAKYWRLKRKYEILNQKNKEKTQAQKYNNLTKQMILESNSLKAKK